MSANAVSLSIVAMIAVCTAVGQPETDGDRRGVLTAQDRRDAGRLLSFLHDVRDDIRLDALIAAGSVQDTILLPSLIESLGSPAPELRRASAFALGQMNDVLSAGQRTRLSGDLLAQMFREEDASVLLATIEALGKTGNAESLDGLISFGRTVQDNKVRGEIALSVGRYAYRGIRNAEATRFAADWMDSEESGSDRWKGASALRRIAVDSLLRPYTGSLEDALGSDDPDVRMFAATALGFAHSSAPRLLEHAENDPDWRVRVNAVRAAPTASPEVSLETLFRLCRDQNEHVSLSAFAALQEIADDRPLLTGAESSILTGIVQATDPRIPQGQRGEAAVTFAAFLRAESETSVREWFDAGLLTAESLLRALRFSGSPGAVSEIHRFASDADPRVQRAALDALNDCATVDSTADPEIVRDAALEALSSDDIAVIATAASLLENPLFTGPENVSSLGGRLSGLRSPDDAEPMVAIITTLGVLKSGEAVPYLMAALNDQDRAVSLEAARSLEKITGHSYLDRVTQHSEQSHTDYDWAFLLRLENHPEVEVETTRGMFRFLMLPDQAPFTCINFARLMSAGFFDGLQFHRVVPNFVVQGGDPRGDGWGGPGYAIRSEFGYSHYDRGMVGVASAGKDTEGCQFFITHSRQPHLDGRYTIFGKVTDGMDVVDRLQIGDTITRMKMSD